MKALDLLGRGHTNRSVAAALGIPRGTVGYWKHLDRQLHQDTYPPPPAGSACPRCDGYELDLQAYAYLLGLYLGDGHIVSEGRANRLAISCANAWPGLMDAAQDAMRRVMVNARVHRVALTGCTAVTSYSRHWVCLFPQHGPGRKHLRRIVLEPWQASVVEKQPEDFIRGLIHSDGCRVINWTTRRVGGVTKRYEYPRYHFSNESADIRNLYTDVLDGLGIEWRYNRRNCVSVARRKSVADLDAFVGPKY